MRALEDLKEMLESELKKITKGGDITPQELDSAYKAIDIIKDIEEISGKEEMGGGYSMRGNSYRGGNSYTPQGPIWNRDMMPYSMDGQSMRGSYNSYEGSYDGSYDGNSNAGRRGRDGDGDGRYSEDYSGRRGRDARTGRYVSRDGRSYDSSGRYSRHTNREQMIEKLEDMMEDAKTEKERMAIMQCIDKLEG